MSIILFFLLIIPFCFINIIYGKDTNITNNLATLFDQVNEQQQMIEHMIKHYNEQHNDATKRFDDKIKEIEIFNQEINKQVNEVNYFLDIMMKIVACIACCSFGHSMYSIMNMMLNKT